MGNSFLELSLRRAAQLLGCLALALAVSAPARADTFNVDVGSDNDQDPAITNVCAELGNNAHCSLRAAITIGNALAGAHTINLSPLVPTITVVNGALPTLAAPFTVNGNHITTIDGNGHGCISLTDSGTGGPIGHDTGATGSKLYNLVIGNCSGDAISSNGHDLVFDGNYLGVDRTGLIAMPNTGHGISVSASQVYPDTSSNFLLNLYNSFPLPPEGAATITAFSSNLVTALASLQPVKITNNLISGNQQNGIEIFSQNLAGVIVSGNKIGTNLTGNAAIANGGHGVRMVGSTFGNLIGPDNVISGNSGDGIRVESGAVFLPNFIMGNRIGLAATDSSAHIGNGANGIYTDTKPSTDPAKMNPSGMSLMIGPSNVIADNKGANNNAFPDTLGADSAGIQITGASSGVKAVGNTVGIGEFPPGTPVASKAYGNAGDGIIVTASGNTIGGTSATSANIIAGNARHGIVLRGSSTVGNSVLGNYIGIHTAFPSNLTLGNGSDGIHLNAVSNSAIGGPGATDFNTVAANGRNGIKLRNGGTSNGWSNLLQRNAVYHNATAASGVGIDHDYAENATDSLHSEFPANYVNLDQAPPVICSGPGDSGACNGSAAPASSGGSTTLDWTIATHGPADFRMEFFRIDNANGNNASSMTFLGEQLVTTDILGNLNSAGCVSNRCGVSLPVNSGGAHIVMTATDITPLTDQPGGGSDWKSNLVCFAANLGVPLLSQCKVNNTSEFSNAMAVPASAPTLTTLAATSITTTTATLNGSVSANGASTTVTFEYGVTNAYGGAGSPAAATGSPVASGAFNAPVSLALSGLTCNTTYHFRVDANNGIGGTINGGDLSFTTAPCAASAPAATTLAASAITTVGATLNGSVAANGATTTVTFEYGPTNAYGGSGSPGTATQSPLSSGSSGAAVSFPLTGLTCNTTYHFRVNADNGVGGTVNGSDLSFTTAACAPSAPSVTTLAASAVTSNGATLNGTVSANGAATTVSFNYGASAPAYGGLGSPVAASQSPLTSGASNAAVSVVLSGLNCNAVYHFQVTANNGVGGTVAGSDLTFQTGACAPAASTAAASNITATSATLNGLVSANGSATDVIFEFGPTNAYGGAGSPAAAAESPVAANAVAAAVSHPLTGLTCNTNYHFRVAANNGVGGTTNGGDLSFTTAACGPAAPTIATAAASAISATGATLNGTVSANGAATTVTFDFGLGAPAYGAAGSPANAAQNPVSSGSSNAAVSAAVTGLTCNTVYHFRANAANGIGGTINGSDLTFTTSACPPPGAPTVTSLAASSVTASGAVLNGTVSANGAQTAVTFEYGTSVAYGGAGSPGTAAQSPLAAGAANAAVSLQLSGLVCNTTYHFRAEANNGVGGTVNGSDLTFTTSICPNTVSITGHTPDPSTTLQTITVNASVTPNVTAPAAPSGNIVVSDGSGGTCTIVLPAASCSLSVTSAGAKTLTAAYGGDVNFAAGSSAGVAHTVSAVQQYSAQTATQSGVATATVSGAGCTFTTAQFIPVAPLVAPAGVTFPHGLFDFKIGGCANGGTATVQVVYPQALPAGAQYWKYGPTPGPQPAHWYALGSGAPNNLSIVGNTATFTLTDGGLGDDDLSANGTIVDQGGIGAAAAIGGSGGVADIPSLNEWGLLILTGLLLMLGIGRLKLRS